MPKQNLKPGIHLHKTIAPNYYTGKHEYYWILIAKNGNEIARSKTYKTKRAAMRSIVVASDLMRFVAPRSFYDHSSAQTKQVMYNSKIK